MSDVQTETAGVQAQYAARVAADLETNSKEQERIGAEVAALQEQLQALENDHAVLLSMQQALGSAGTSATAAKKASSRKKSVPAPRASANNGRATRSKKPAASKSTAATAKPKASAKQPAAPKAGPTLVELIDNHLGQQHEPRSAAEITTALAQALPDRTIKTTVVRTTVEGLVAKGRVQRTKQGSSVFYTAATSAEQPASPRPETSTS
ncbi:BlaI/MecI/CopY family transcriptional regulator [Streptomyces atriruber]|uniref:BlaI/MecI/CopY family transcriptional regulator n=1 Tax=Streptomyces atriruber TaxID=545121 RepID=A0ABV3BJH7_9ACTN